MVKKFVISAAATLLVLSFGSQARAYGNIKEGEKAFRKCAICHDIRPGKHKIGPSLHGVFGRKSAAAAGYRYSPAMQKAGITCDDAALHKYLENPRKLVPGTRMAFAGVRSQKERDDLVAFLKSLK